MIAHFIDPGYLTDKTNKKLRQICQSILRLAENEYVVHHPEQLIKSCPLCEKSSK